MTVTPLGAQCLRRGWAYEPERSAGEWAQALRAWWGWVRAARLVPAALLEVCAYKTPLSIENPPDRQ